jgi:acyl carrier protein
MHTIEQEVRSYILENFFFSQEGSLSNDASFMEMGIIDSTGVLELVAFLEEKYAIKIDADELIPENLDSITRLACFVSRKLGIVGNVSSARDQGGAHAAVLLSPE